MKDKFKSRRNLLIIISIILISAITAVNIITFRILEKTKNKDHKKIYTNIDKASSVDSPQPNYEFHPQTIRNTNNRSRVNIAAEFFQNYLSFYPSNVDKSKVNGNIYNEKIHIAAGDYKDFVAQITFDVKPANANPGDSIYWGVVGKDGFVRNRKIMMRIKNIENQYSYTLTEVGSDISTAGLNPAD
ncbi:MAG: hypothetical protein ABF633_17395 [Clostridium sp.]|uniref:hypothetical protein n=1 Tax=Clostridium sp. TaxID=1506 RepID=UPI0039EA63A5